MRDVDSIMAHVFGDDDDDYEDIYKMTLNHSLKFFSKQTYLQFVEFCMTQKSLYP